MQRLRAHLSPALIYSGSKGLAFATPLVVASYATLSDYGRLEYCLATASALVGPLSMGISLAIPYFLLKRDAPEYRDALWFHSVFLTLALIAADFAQAAGFVNDVQSAVLFATIALTCQLLRATFDKVDGRPAAASAWESALFIPIALLLGAAWWFDFQVSFDYLSALIEATTHLFVLLLLLKLRGTKLVAIRDLLRRYVNVVSYSLPLLLPVALTAGLAASGRVLAGNYLSPEDTGTFALVHRLLSCVVLVHQFVNTLYFRSLYAGQGTALDIRSARVLIAMTTSATIVALAISIFGGALMAALRSALSEYPALPWFFAIYMILWTAGAQIEGWIYRENKGRYVVMLAAGAIALNILGATAFAASGSLTVFSLTALQLICMLGFVVGGLVTLHSLGIRLVRTQATLVVGVSTLALFGAAATAVSVR